MSNYCPLSFRSRSSAALWDEIGSGWVTEAPVQLAPDPFSDGFCWIVTGRDAIDHVSRNPLLYSSAARSAMPEEYSDSALNILRNQLINMDPPRHKAHRAILTRHFSEQARARYRPHIERFAEQAVDAMLATDHCEFVEQVATELPFLTIMHILGLPAIDRIWIAPLVGQVLFGEQTAKATAASELYLYALKQLHLCRRGRAVSGSLMTSLMDATEDGKPLSDAEIISLLVFVLIAGTFSTRATISKGMLLFIEHPEQYRRLSASPQLVSQAIEEIMRHSPAFTCMRRTALSNTVLEGVPIAQGEKLLLCYRAGHFSPRSFGPSPHDFDVGRVPEPGNTHRAFGSGQHFCLGNGIARMELAALFSTLAQKVFSPRLLSPPKFSNSLHLDDIQSLRIQYMRAPAYD